MAVLKPADAHITKANIQENIGFPNTSILERIAYASKPAAIEKIPRVSVSTKSINSRIMQYLFQMDLKECKNLSLI